MQLTREFLPAPGASFGAEKAQRYGEFLHNLADERGGELTPQEIVSAARPQSSPIHDHFEWNDTVAAENHRLWQARHMTNHIRVKVVYDNGREGEQPLFTSLKVIREDREERRYVNLRVIAESEDLREQVIREAMDLFNTFRRRYHNYRRIEPLSRVFDIIEEVEGDLV